MSVGLLHGDADTFCRLRRRDLSCARARRAPQARQGSPGAGARVDGCGSTLADASAQKRQPDSLMALFRKAGRARGQVSAYRPGSSSNLLRHPEHNQPTIVTLNLAYRHRGHP